MTAKKVQKNREEFKGEGGIVLGGHYIYLFCDTTGFKSDLEGLKFLSYL